MSDRCYMQLTCRRQDQAQFEAMGFHLEFADTQPSAILELIDTAADNAHRHELPLDIPFLAMHEAGEHYAGRCLACDGKCLVDAPATSEGFVIQWDDVNNEPSEPSLARIRSYLTVRERVTKLFGGSVDFPAKSR